MEREPDPRVAAVERLTLRDGRNLCARRWPGAGGGTVVLLHGLLDSSEGWTGLAERIDCDLVAFDLPGFGCSDAPPLGTMFAYARDIAEGLAQLGIDRFVLVGHSLGGGVATALAEMLPDKVQALVLLAPTGFGRIKLAEAATAPGVTQVVQAALPFALSSRLAVTAAYTTMVANGLAPEHELVERLTSHARERLPGAREAVRAVARAGRSRNGFHRRRVAYDGPVVAIWGDRDRLVPVSHARGVLAAFPQARVSVWRGMGHHHQRERLQDLVATIGHVAGAARRAIAPEAQPLAEAA
jgi:pimeloyl-ACP methyl ester carboxylesterase